MAEDGRDRRSDSGFDRGSSGAGLRGGGWFTCAGVNIHILSQTQLEEGFLDIYTLFFFLFFFQYGLYSAFMGCFVYCIFGTSKDITLGPTAIMSLLCSAYVDGDPVFAVVLTLLCGVIQTGMALLRLGKMENGVNVNI